MDSFNRISTIVLYLVWVLFSFECCCCYAGEPDNKDESNGSLHSVNKNPKRQPQKIVPLANQQLETVKQYWKQTFAEISNMTLRENSARKSPRLTQWKSFKTKSPTRFDGFASWDRLLQDWADDIADYIEEKSQHSDAGYPMSTFGRTRVVNDTTLEKQQPHHHELVLDEEEEDVILQKKQQPPTLPIPSPALSGQEILPHTDIGDKSKKIWIVTTAALPWMTGTAVNPLLRAAYLTKGRPSRHVALHLPWLERTSDQERVYNGRVFETQADQEAYIRNWLSETAGMEQASRDLRIEWYTAWQQRAENSLYSMGDITALIPEDEVDICILEEPEHLNWYRAPGESWTEKFKHVVGIIHTNYFCYAQEQPAALIRAPGMRLLCSWMCRAHCHRVIKLSGTLGQFCPEKELVENVHGVRQTFLTVGENLQRSPKYKQIFSPNATPTVYFIGKMLWSKGLGSLMELLKYAEESADLKIKVDMYGGGPDQEAASVKSKKLGLDMPFHGPIDHAELAETHKVFINPSTSEVLCTTVAEALAMGKFVVLPSHPSNDFFAQFPNCLPYSTKEEFVGNLYYALTHSPEPLTEEYAYALSWDAATERLEAAGCITVEEEEAKSHALASREAGVEINLPPLIEDEEARRAISNTLHRTRSRYRQFRSRLSQEIQQSNVLPKDLQKRLVHELDKRLDIDIETIIESPKLRLQLSPAELDNALLEFYNQVTVGPSGDLLRVIGGGTDVGRQDLYLRQQARKRLKGEQPTVADYASVPTLADADDVDRQDTITKLVKRALNRNLPSRNKSFQLNSKERKSTRLRSKKSETPKMSIQQPSHQDNGDMLRMRVPLGMRAHPLVRSSWTSYTPLI